MDEENTEAPVVKYISPKTTWRDVVVAVLFFGTIACLILTFITNMAWLTR